MERDTRPSFVAGDRLTALDDDDVFFAASARGSNHAFQTLLVLVTDSGLNPRLSELFEHSSIEVQFYAIIFSNTRTSSVAPVYSGTLMPRVSYACGISPTGREFFSQTVCTEPSAALRGL